jgi:hypothetical protein
MALGLLSNMLNSQEIPPELALTMKLEGIFRPHAHKHRGDFVAKNQRFAHYTSADNALKIIKSKRLWMRNTTCMTDYSEVAHGYRTLVSFFSDDARRKAFTDALDLSAPGAAMEALTLFDQWWNQLQFNSYVASISEHADSEDLHGRLSMWRAFGGTSARVALVMRIPMYAPVKGEQLHLVFSPVAYVNGDHVHTVMRMVIENISAEADFLRTLDRGVVVAAVFHMLMAGATCAKHEGFSEERGWRGIYTPKRMASSLMIQSTEVIGGIPQIVHQIPLDESVSPDLAHLELARIFDRLIVGPTSYPWAMYEAFVDALTKAGVPDAANRVRISEIPLRS